MVVPQTLFLYCLVAFGGALASLSILLDNEFGWQQAMQIIGLAGFSSVVLSIFLLQDDKKADTNISPQLMEAKEEEKPRFFEDLGEIFSSPRAKWIYIASFLRFCSGLCIGVWSAPYFKQLFPDNAADYAVAQALISGLAASASGILGGKAADWLSSNTEEGEGGDSIGAKLWVPVVGSALAAPAWYFAVHSTDSFQTAMVWLSIEYLVAECWFGPTISTLLGTVQRGGTAQGLFTLTGAVANLAPTLLGIFYGEATSGTGTEPTTELLNLLSAGVCLCYILSAICFAVSAKSSPTAEEKIIDV
jgi:hypothetical protein